MDNDVDNEFDDSLLVEGLLPASQADTGGVSDMLCQSGWLDARRVNIPHCSAMESGWDKVWGIGSAVSRERLDLLGYSIFGVEWEDIYLSHEEKRLDRFATNKRLSFCEPSSKVLDTIVV